MSTTDLLLIAVFVSILISIALNIYQNKKNNNNSEILSKNDLSDVEEKLEKKLDNVNTSVNEKMLNLNKDVTKEVSLAMTQFNERLGSFDKSLGFLKESQDNFNKILGGVKQFGGTAEWGLKAIVSDSLPNSMFVENAKLNPATRDFVEIAIKLPTNVLLPIDSHWPQERYADVVKAFNENDKESLKDSRRLLASAIKKKALEVKEKYINPPISTPFAFIYVPTEGIYNELVNYSDPKTKINLAEELQKDFQVTIVGPNTIFHSIQAFNIGFATLKVQKYALQIYDDLRSLQKRFAIHFNRIANVSKKLEETMEEVNKFGTDARVLNRALENIKDPSQPEKLINHDEHESFKDQTKLKN
tara:strand:- start:63 stop:1139 length:1077 start_codon:yes stop_codon:yes gene_type:complete